MKHYVVGKPISFQTIKENFFSLHWIESDLKDSKNLKIFSSKDDAFAYARSLKEKTEHGIKFAPVVYVDKLKNYPEETPTQVEDIIVKEYRQEGSGSVDIEYKCKIKFQITSFSAEAFSISAVEFPDSNCPITPFYRAPLSFFRALNPTSKNSGIIYCKGNHKHYRYAQEIVDYTVEETFRHATMFPRNFLGDLELVFEILVGRHFNLKSRTHHLMGDNGKGLLDFLILPLIARKLIADTYVEERKDSFITNALAWAIAVPIEAARFGTGISITLLLSPVVIITHLIKACLCPTRRLKDSTRCTDELPGELTMECKP